MDKLHHWTNHWDAIASQIARQPKLLIASDFDGTLAPIARTPMEAVLPAETRTLLRRLAACPGVHLAVISGRAIDDVKMHVGIEDLFYAGNHGLELSGPGIELHNPQSSKAHGELDKVVVRLVEKTAPLSGVFIENKGPTAAVHFRLASDESRAVLSDLVHLAIAEYPRLRLGAGKCVWELRPKEGWNKGDALTHLTTRLGLGTEAAMYLGDDLTDEDAFLTAKNDLTFRVGGASEATAARFRIRDATDAQAFLLCVLGLRSGQRLPEHKPCLISDGLFPTCTMARLN